jgi:hypothetical protein
MNYQSHYSRLIARARARDSRFLSLFEKHHIIPRCIGGADADANIVKLTPQEHFVAHRLLVKMHPGHLGLLAALALMHARTNKERLSFVVRLRRAMSNARRGKQKSAAHRQAIGSAQKGQAKSARHRRAMSEVRVGKVVPHLNTPATIAKISAALRGQPKSDAHRAALSVAARRRIQRRTA